MPINTALLIAAPMLQDALVDKDGTPMANGTVTLYHDLNRTQLKNWYYQTGTPGSPTFTPLQNPLTLSAAGTITDVNGVDTIPFYYPYLESDQTILDPYYVVIQNAAQTNTITRSNFPYTTTKGSVTTGAVTFQNFIANNGFWRNIAPNKIGVTPVSTALAAPFLVQTTNVNIGGISTIYSGIVSPSQHDGFAFPDVQFIKNTLTATDAVTFLPFPLSLNQPITTPNTNTPEYYLSHNCSVAAGDESIKCYSFPLAMHINNLNSLVFTTSIQAQSPTTNVSIQLQLLQFTGTGTTSPAPKLIGQTSLLLGPGWQQFSLSDITPPTLGLTLGQGSDDAFYLLVILPTNKTFTINFTKPCFYLTQNQVPAFDYQTYDMVNSIISAPRTGDLRISTNSFIDYGWVAMNDGLLGISNSSGSGNYARANADTWPLFNLLWLLAHGYDSGSNFNPLCQLYTVSNVGVLTPTNYGAGPFDDFIFSSGGNTKALALTRSMGRVLLGGVPLTREIPLTFAQVVTFDNVAGLLRCNVTAISSGTTTYFYTGQPVSFREAAGTLPSTISNKGIYYVTLITGNTFLLATTYGSALAYTADVTYPIPPIVGTFSVFTSLNGTAVGEYSHLQNTNEVGSHIHTIGVLNAVPGGGAGTATASGAGAAQTGPNANTFPSSQVPFNITQPGTYYNVYIKL